MTETKRDTRKHRVASLGLRHYRRPNGLLGGATVLALGMTPLLMVFPEGANAQELAIQGAQIATQDLAVTERQLEQVSLPEDYVTTDEISAENLAVEENAILPSSDPAVDEQPNRAEASIARALVSSPTAVLGVTFPLNNADETAAISYRTRQGELWGEWKALELAEVGNAPDYVEYVTVGTEPIPLTDADEVEVAVKSAEGESLPGAVLTLIEPELSADELHDAQVDVHGQQAVEAVESVLDDVTADTAESAFAVSKEKAEASEEAAPESELREPQSDAVAGEEGEDAAVLETPVATGLGGQTVGGALTKMRAVGPTADGNSYVTDLEGLTITTRKGWGADERAMDWKPEKVTFKGAVIHHTAGSNNYTKAQVSGLVRGIYRYHAVSLGWGDVGYHLLVDKYGGVWEGRSGGLTNSVEGGHAYGANSTTFGVSVLGDYSTVKPSDEALDAVAKAVAWKLKVHKITNLDATFTTKGKQWGKSSIQLPVVSAHRHVGGTSCPGDAFMTRFEELRAKVKHYSEKLKQGNASPAPATVPLKQRRPIWAPTRVIGHGWKAGNTFAAGAFFGEGHTDGMIIDSVGRMWLYPGKDHGNFYAPRRHIGNGWYILDQISAGIDFDGDSHPDVLGRLKSNGELRLYPGDGKGGFKKMRRIGYGWGIFESIHILPDLVNGQAVVYAVEQDTHRMRAYLTDGKGGFTTRRDLGGNWEGMRSLNSVGDKSTDGKTDFVVVDAAGKMWLYAGDNRGGFTEKVQVGHGLQDLNPIVSSGEPGNFWAVNPQGTLLRYTLTELK